MKSQLRKEMIELRKDLSKKEAERLSKEIFLNLFKIIDFDAVKKLMLYYPINNEVSTLDIIDFCFKRQIEVILPKVLKDKREIIPCKIECYDDLKIGVFGIMEPMTCNVIPINEIDAVIVPGVAFSREGYRLGYGAGYYDRLLKDYKGYKIGVCYSFQIVETVFEESHDIKMDFIVSEKEIIDVR